MNPLLIRDAFADAQASARASTEAPAVHAETARIAEHYISLANSNVAETSGSAVSVRTMTKAEYLAKTRPKAT